MLRSMTGFGRYLAESTVLSQQWEVRSVNSRYLDIKWHLPTNTYYLEQRLEKIVRKYASRGRIEVTLYLHFVENCGLTPFFDTVRANAILNALHKLAQTRQENFIPDYNALLALPNLWEEAGEEISEELQEQLLQGLELALEDWNDGRATEGKALKRDLQARILRIEEWTTLLLERVPSIKEQRATTLRERLSENLAQCGMLAEDSRILQEIVLLLDKLDVTEELTRLNTHLGHLRDLLEDGQDVGKRLDFTLQECFREINTCGNKFPDVQLSHLIVDFKNELEKCREQVQNLE